MILMNLHLVSVSNNTKDDVSTLHRPCLDMYLIRMINKYRPYIFSLRGMYNPSTKVCIDKKINEITNLTMNTHILAS